MGSESQTLLFGVRTLIRSKEPDRADAFSSFEERVVIVEAASFQEAITLGEGEAKRYVSEFPKSWNAVLLDDVQAFEIASAPIRPGDEVWSVIRRLNMTDTEFRDYLSRGDEVRVIKSEPSAAPNGGPSTRLSNSGGAEAPPSVS